VKIMVLALVAAFACIGCNNKEQAAPTPTKTEKAPESTKEATKAPTTPAAVAAADPDDDIATTTDFEDEAEKDITKDSLDSEVDKLAKEIGE